MARKLNETRCIKQVPVPGSNSYCLRYYNQCNRKRGHGPGGQYCKQHDPNRIKAEYRRKNDERMAEYKKKDEQHKRTQVALALVDGIPTEEISNYKLVLKNKEKYGENRTQ